MQLGKEDDTVLREQRGMNRKKCAKSKPVTFRIGHTFTHKKETVASL